MTEWTWKLESTQPSRIMTGRTNTKIIRQLSICCIGINDGQIDLTAWFHYLYFIQKKWQPTTLVLSWIETKRKGPKYQRKQIHVESLQKNVKECKRFSPHLSILSIKQQKITATSRSLFWCLLMIALNRLNPCSTDCITQKYVNFQCKPTENCIW